MNTGTVQRGTAFALCLCLAGTVCAQSLVINEIHYDPSDKTIPEEFIELYNPGTLPVDLTGWYFSDGISYAFPEGVVVEAGAYLVIAEDPEVFMSRYGDDLPLLGPYEGRFSNEGEDVILRDQAGTIVDRVDYRIGFPWPLASAGRGSSMELIHPLLENDLGGSWRASGSST